MEPTGSKKMSITLEDGSRVAVIGGGPAGSMFTYFLLTFAQRMDLDLSVDIYEPRDFAIPGPAGCNMCGGIVSESLVQSLAFEGITLPSTVVQRGISSYVLHTDDATIQIDTPQQEKKIATIYRGGGPRDIQDVKHGSLDGYLQGLARGLGAKVIPTRVRDVGWSDGRPQVLLKGESQTYDLLVAAFGVNSPGWQLLEKLGFRAKPPRTTRAYITELKLGAEVVGEYFGSSMHMFLLDIENLDCAAIIPKGEFVTFCLLGSDIDKALVDDFFQREAVRRCFPPDWSPGQGACHCSPKINIREADRPFLDRVVLVGDCGVTRLYKDGIGAAYRATKAAALTAVFDGVSAEDFQKNYWPAYRSIARDNRFGLLIFYVVHWIKAVGPLIRGVMRMTAREQKNAGSAKRMSTMLWDMFTGSASYREVFSSTLDPRFQARFLWESLLSVGSRGGIRRRD